MLVVKCAQLVAKLQMAVEKRDRAHRSSASCFAREGVGYLDEL